MHMVEIQYVTSKTPRLRPAIAGDAGYDLSARLASPTTLFPRCTTRIPTGIKIHINDPGIGALVLARSGLGTKFRVRPANCVGLIDSGYTGELIVTCENAGTIPHLIEPGQRIAQLVFVPIIHPALVEVDQFSAPTERGTYGHGHTGTTT